MDDPFLRLSNLTLLLDQQKGVGRSTRYLVYDEFRLAHTDEFELLKFGYKGAILILKWVNAELTPLVRAHHINYWAILNMGALNKHVTFSECDVINIPISFQPNCIIVQFWTQITSRLQSILVIVLGLVLPKPFGCKSLRLFLTLGFRILGLLVFLKLFSSKLFAEWTSELDDDKVLVIHNLRLDTFLQQVLNVGRI